MNEFDKTIRIVMPFALLLLVIFVVSMQLSGNGADRINGPNNSNWFSPFSNPGPGGTPIGLPGNIPAANRPEVSWETQLVAVRSGQTDRIEVTRDVLGDEFLLQLKGLDGLRELIIDKAQVTDEGLAPLTTLRGLEHLRLRGARIHDAGFRQICTIASLKQLNLPQADLTDVGLESLSALRQLELLRMGSPRVTDFGIAQIAKLTKLRALHLIDIPVTDESVKTFEAIQTLESLYLDGARVSDTGYTELFRTRPALHVHINQKHHDRDPHKGDHVD